MPSISIARYFGLKPQFTDVVPLVLVVNVPILTFDCCVAYKYPLALALIIAPLDTDAGELPDGVFLE